MKQRKNQVLKYAVAFEEYKHSSSEKNHIGLHTHILLIFSNYIDTRNSKYFDFTFNQKLYHGNYQSAKEIDSVFFYLNKTDPACLHNFTDGDIFFKTLQNYIEKIERLETTNEALRKQITSTFPQTTEENLSSVSKPMTTSFSSPLTNNVPSPSEKQLFFITELKKKLKLKELNDFSVEFLHQNEISLPWSRFTHDGAENIPTDMSIGLEKDTDFWKTVAQFQEDQDWEGLKNYLKIASPKIYATGLDNLKKNMKAMRTTEPSFVDIEDIDVLKVKNIPLVLKVFAGLQGFRIKTLVFHGPSGVGKTILAKLTARLAFKLKKVLVLNRFEFLKNMDLSFIEGFIYDDVEEIFTRSREDLILILTKDHVDVQIAARYSPLNLKAKNVLTIITTNRGQAEFHRWRTEITRRSTLVFVPESIFKTISNEDQFLRLSIEDFYEISSLFNELFVYNLSQINLKKFSNLVKINQFPVDHPFYLSSTDWERILLLWIIEKPAFYAYRKQALFRETQHPADHNFLNMNIDCSPIRINSEFLTSFNSSKKSLLKQESFDKLKSEFGSRLSSFLNLFLIPNTKFPDLLIKIIPSTDPTEFDLLSIVDQEIS